MHGPFLNGVPDMMENQHLPVHGAMEPFNHMSEMPMFTTNSGKKKAKDKQVGRLNGFKSHHKAKEQQYNAITEIVYTEEIQETQSMRKKFIETKAKKTKKEKGDKTAKKNDVLSVSVINDENRSSAAFHHQQRINNVPSVNGGTIASPPSSLTPVKPDQFDRDLPSNGTTDSHHSGGGGGGGGGVHGGDSFFLSQLMSGDELPDLSLAGGGSLDDLLPNDGPDQLAGLALDVGNMLEEMSHQINVDCRQQLDSLDHFSPHMDGNNTAAFNGGGGREVKTPLPLTGLSNGGAPTTVGGSGQQHHHHHHLQQQRVTPDSINANVKRLDEQMLAQQSQKRQHLMHQQQHQAAMMQQFPQQRTNSMSPFATGGDAQQHQPPPGMCFSPGTDGVPAGYAATNPGMQQQHNGYGGRGQYGQVMRMTQGSPGMAAGGGGGPRWQQADPTSSVPLTHHQQKQMSLVPSSTADLPYGQATASMQQHSIGPMGAGGPGKQPVFLQGAPGYPTNQMPPHRAQGLPGPYSYVNGNNGGGGGGGTRPTLHHGQPAAQQQQSALQQQQQQQYRSMMQSGGGQSVMQPGKPYPGSAGYSPTGHMLSMPPYQQNVHNAIEAQQQQQQQIRHMTGYRPPYPQHQQPVQVQQHHPQQQQSPTFLTSSPSINPTALQQQQSAQQQQQQAQHFYHQQQQNGFAGGAGGGGGGGGDLMSGYPQQSTADTAHMYGTHMYGPP